MTSEAFAVTWAIVATTAAVVAVAGWRREAKMLNLSIDIHASIFLALIERTPSEFRRYEWVQEHVGRCRRWKAIRGGDT